MDSNIKVALNDIQLIKNIISNTKIVFEEVKNFYLWLAISYFLSLSSKLLEIVLRNEKIMQGGIVSSVIYLCLNILIIVIYIYYRRKMSDNRSYFSVFLLDMWGISLILSKFISIIAIFIFKEKYEFIHYFSAGIATMTFTLCILCTGLLLKSKYLQIIAGLFCIFNTISIVLPNFKFEMLHDMVMIYPSHILFSRLSIIIVCFCIYFYFKNYGEKYVD